MQEEPIPRPAFSPYKLSFINDKSKFVPDLFLCFNFTPGLYQINCFNFSAA
jgi:hypothetical protein